MKAVRQFSIVLIFSLQPAVTTHLINTSVLAQLSTPSPLPQDGHAGDGDDGDGGGEGDAHGTEDQVGDVGLDDIVRPEAGGLGLR